MSEPPILGRTKDLVTQRLRDAVASLDPHLRTAADYHFGWVDAAGAPTDAGGGKAIRPALALLGAEAVGGSSVDAVAGAVAVELIHNFSLVHDDIMDGDRTRRHRPTVWAVFGVGDAILVGDALHTLAFQQLLRPDDARHAMAASRLAEATGAVIEGQAQDIGLDRRPDATLAETSEMEANKTGALLACSAAIGGVLGSGRPDQVDALERHGGELGLAFQAIDDVLGIWGDPDVTGKPAGNDLREQKKSVPVAIALEAGGELADRIRAAFGGGEMTDGIVAELSTAMEAAGIRVRAERLAERHLAAALAALDTAPFEPGPSAELGALARFVVEREH